MPISLFDHYTVRARDLEVSVRFYTDVMGFRAEPLGTFEFPMQLMFCAEHAIVHLLGAGAALDRFLGRTAPSHVDDSLRKTGNIEHVAFNGTDLQEFISRLKRAGVEFVERPLPVYGVTQLLFEDPDGIEIEVNFPQSQRQA